MECPAPLSVPNSQPQFDVNSPPNAIGSVLQYACNNGSLPKGSVRCQVDGTWTQMSCIKYCLSPPVIPNSNQLFNASTTPRSEGTSLQYECHSGFVPQNNVTAITCENNSEWTNIVCKRPDCPSPPIIANSNELFNRSTVSTVYRATLQYGCNTGFVAENGVENITCDLGASWTTMPCKRPDCPSPPSFTNSNKLFNPSTVSTAYGETLQYECRHGFAATNGVTAITCGVDATWTSIDCKENCTSPPPTFTNSDPLFDPLTTSTVYGTILKYRCKPGFKPKNGISSITCQLGATWTNIACSLIRSCSEVKACNNGYGDDDYWIYPPAYENAKARIFCHGMLTGLPTEFVSLVRVNDGKTPSKSNENCRGEKLETDILYGETNFHKIRVNIQNMEVNRTDSTYTKTYSGTVRPYGEAYDKYASHTDGCKRFCGPVGYFHINMDGIGLIVDRSLTFPVYGTNSWGEMNRYANGTRIDLVCGGFPGGCRPKGPMMLRLEGLEPNNDSAIMPTCV
ncbi:zona pellucida sperm-binding protein 3 receptor-like isoform X2 [Gigantopelta aegis]|uniref:zona pellucida sperm-binding protein 3 receptor-like isoform X2 n=1 Tax=Gigantopelta aegis TaxID=1735272 RepID=UPI001B88BC23|nr:zona pellucida sperm-binding protein 3 receptor-like isoform X2 [Gigantopelta aegis]